jgi:hypothetical protein
MDKAEFQRRLERAGERARLLAEHFVIEELPPQLYYIMPDYDNDQGKRGPLGTIKYYGGRFLLPDDLRLVTARRATNLLWMDGKVPDHITVFVDWAGSSSTHIRLLSYGSIVVADENKLPRDLPRAWEIEFQEIVDESDSIEPFHIRGPSTPLITINFFQEGNRISLIEVRKEEYRRMNSCRHGKEENERL